MINPGVYDLVCPQGVTFDKQFTWTVGGVPVNLTGYTAALQVRSGWDASEPLISLATGGQGIVLGGTAGTIDVAIAATVTDGLEPGSYAYDLELYEGSDVVRLLQGAFNVTGGVTR